MPDAEASSSIRFTSQLFPWSSDFIDGALSGARPLDLWKPESARLLELAEMQLQQGPGFLVLTGLQDLDADGIRRIVEWVSAQLGDIVLQDKSGTLVREVRDRGTTIGQGETSRYADSRHGGNLHTDGAEKPQPVPDYFTLACVRQAPEGGSLVLSPLDSVLALLNPTAADILGDEFHFDRRGDREPDEPLTVVKRILFTDDEGTPAVTYLRKYVESGHGTPDTPSLSAEQTAALDAFDEAMSDPSVTIIGKLAPGDIAVFSNVRLLHGRTTFVDYPDPARARLLYRTWIRRFRSTMS